MRILHVVENLDKGAVENWLVNIFLESKKVRPDWDWTFYCILGRKGRLDERVIAAGGKIVYSPYWISDKFSFLKALRKTLKEGKFDIIHSHHDYLSGFYLCATAGIDFKRRLLHIHNTDKGLPIGNERIQKLLLKPFRRLAIYFSDYIVGISKDTLSEFTYNKGLKNKRCSVLYYGINLSPFKDTADRLSVCKEIGIPDDAKMLLFVGRMNTLKNPVFVIDILERLTEIRKDVYAVFIGKGEQEELVLQRTKEKGLQNKVRLMGWRDDTAIIMKAADVFVFPRFEYPKEGLGLVVVEAQAAGLPMALSNGIVPDAIEIPELAFIIDLANNPEEWAKRINEVLTHGTSVNRTEAYHRMNNSKFEIRKATENFIALYES
ncbi:glycosyltransferase [Longitalea arenae]|uniref:glycosyltransferase n=1 Tax=Longitalea arenae TaxID=2812558 RepID=UPI00196868F3|nr:glycosyltransferase [Longitalea arenae]